MEALIFQPKNKEQLSALKAFARAFKVPFKTEIIDETLHLKSTDANKKSLDKGINQIENGQTVKVELSDLWK